MPNGVWRTFNRLRKSSKGVCCLACFNTINSSIIVILPPLLLLLLLLLRTTRYILLSPLLYLLILLILIVLIQRTHTRNKAEEATRRILRMCCLERCTCRLLLLLLLLLIYLIVLRQGICTYKTGGRIPSTSYLVTRYTTPVLYTLVVNVTTTATKRYGINKSQPDRGGRHKIEPLGCFHVLRVFCCCCFLRCFLVGLEVPWRGALAMSRPGLVRPQIFNVVFLFLFFLNSRRFWLFCFIF